MDLGLCRGREVYTLKLICAKKKKKKELPLNALILLRRPAARDKTCILPVGGGSVSFGLEQAFRG